MLLSQPDYFALPRSTSTQNYTHFSIETPCPSPTLSPGDDIAGFPEHPLLANREASLASPILDMSSSSFMSRQTAAAHGHSSARPRPYPIQNVLHVTSDDSTSSDSSKSSVDSTISSPELARCSRCQRTPSIDVQTGKSNMVQYGLNLWYCSRCAGLVGLTKR